MDYDRFRAKLYHKARWYYVNELQDGKTKLYLYRSYRHYKKCAKLKETECIQYLTKIVNPTAGIGDQLANWITGYYYAKLFNLEYAYSPFYPSKWNDFFGFYEKEISERELIKNYGYRKVWLPFFGESSADEIELTKKIINSYRGKKVIFYIEISQVYGEQFGVIYDIRKKFNQSIARANDHLIFNIDCINIAVHVRRGDISLGQEIENTEMAMRWLDNSYYENILKQVVNILKNANYRIYLFSQGKVEDFLELKQFNNVEFCLDMSAMDSFLHMVKADILVTSKSSFSYKPALLSEGIKICPKEFWHGYPLENDWILADNYGDFKDELLRRKYGINGDKNEKNFY